MYMYQWHVCRVQYSSPRHDCGDVSAHVAGEVGEVTLVEDDIIHNHLQGTVKETGDRHAEVCVEWSGREREKT